MSGHDEQQRAAAANVAVYCQDHGALPGEPCTPTMRACARRKIAARLEPSSRDETTVRATMRHLSPALRVAGDYAALPGVAGVEDHADRRAVTLYAERGLPVAALERLQADVERRREVNVLVAWKRCRRSGLERRSVLAGGLPPIPPEARWE